jgi:hypothetical protein
MAMLVEVTLEVKKATQYASRVNVNKTYDPMSPFLCILKTDRA